MEASVLICTFTTTGRLQYCTYNRAIAFVCCGGSFAVPKNDGRAVDDVYDLTIRKIVRTNVQQLSIIGTTISSTGACSRNRY